LARILSGLCICLILLGMVAVAHAAPSPINGQDFACPGTPQRGCLFDYVVLIIMENHSLCSIVGSIVIGCAASNIAPYETELAQSYTLATNYTALAHPSPPNYVALIGGSTFNMSSECFPGYPCGSDHLCCPINATNLVDNFDRAGLTWKGYAEDYKGGCQPGGDQLPFNYFWDILHNATRCQNLLSAEKGYSLNMTGNPTIFLNALGSTETASNFMWLSPSPCDQWHHLCSGSGVTNQGDYYLSTLVPRILDSTIFTTQRAALFVLYDEGNFHDTCPSGRGDCVYAVWTGPQVKKGYICSTRYSHYSFLATLELNWGLENLTANDGSASPMTNLFTNGPPCRLQTGFAFSLGKTQAGQTISFSGQVSGGTQPYSFAWNFGDGDPGTGQDISHAYRRAGSYTATVTVTDASGETVTASHTLTVTSAPLCILCLIKNPVALLLLIGLPAGLVAALVSMVLVRRRRRKAILKLALFPP
jgi:phosphatidylinositol-3-phosphatase